MNRLNRRLALPVRHVPPRATVHGLTLVELMVAMALGLLLLGALVALVVSNMSNRSELDKNVRQIENGRHALHLLSEDIQLAGFIGTTGLRWHRRAPPQVCAAGVDDLGYVSDALPLPVQLLSRADCLGQVQPGTDILLLTRVSSRTILPENADSSEIYVQVSTCKNDKTPLVVAEGSSSGFVLRQKECADTSRAPLRRAIHRIYFISTCHVCAGAAKDSVPTLKMAEFAQGKMQVTPLAEGIENLQFDFGIDTDGNGSPDWYVSNPDATVDNTEAYPKDFPSYKWDEVERVREDVMAVRVHLLARGTETSGGWKDQRIYDLGLGMSSVGPFNDSYKRHVHSAVARLNNPAGLRERP